MKKNSINDDVSLAKKKLLELGLYIATKKDINKLSENAMEAYQEYPLHIWFSGGSYNPQASKIIMQISLKTMMKKAVIYADSSEINGFAVWLPPGFKGTNSLLFLLNGGLRLIFYSGFGIIKKLIEYENAAMSLKKKITNHNDWYAYNLSVVKKVRGQGLATKLFKPMLDFVSEKKAICYLETNNEKNVSLYEHFGFKIAEKSFVPNTKISHYAMIRQVD